MFIGNQHDLWKLKMLAEFVNNSRNFTFEWFLFKELFQMHKKIFFQWNESTAALFLFLANNRTDKHSHTQTRKKVSGTSIDTKKLLNTFYPSLSGSFLPRWLSNFPYILIHYVSSRVPQFFVTKLVGYMFRLSCFII